MAENEQLFLPFGPVHNSELFSNYWLTHRLPLEPDWHEVLPLAERAAARLMRLWKEQKPRVEIYGKEAPLEEKFIQPVLEELGWTFYYQPHVQGREPDYALFTSETLYDRALAAGHRSPEFWSDVAVVADAKAWHISLDRPHRVDGRKEYPPEQMEWYLERTRVAWGILTNGRLWRLIPRVVPSGKPRFQTYLEINLPSVLEALSGRDRVQTTIAGDHLREFLSFYLLFRPAAFTPSVERSALIDRAALGSSAYALGVSEDLKERVFEALRIAIEGFLRRPQNGLSSSMDLEICRENGFILLYRLLFIMYAEDRSLLPYRINQTYTSNRSLAHLRDEVASSLDKRGPQRFSATDTAIWQDLVSLFDLVDSGHARYGVPAYNGGLFSPEHHPFLAAKALADRDAAQIIDKLSRTFDPEHPNAGLFRVDYRDLAIRQLGSVYEGLLEMHPRYASENLIVIRSTRTGSTSELFHPVAAPVPQGFRATGEVVSQGTVYLETDKGERRATGSYYTPDHIVDHIVQRTLQPVCARVQAEIEAEISVVQSDLDQAAEEERAFLRTRLDNLHGQFGERILSVRVLDPAMGSGHFLTRACQYLAEEIATSPYTADPAAEPITEDHSTLSSWKRRVAEHCLFGVDKNPLAVELAKLALWLETVSKEKPLAFLDHHLRRGNSLVGARLDQLDRLPSTEPLFAGLLTAEFDQSKSEMFAPLNELHRLESDSASTVKQKERLLRTYESRVNGFVAIADLWCGELFRTRGQPTIGEMVYANLIRNLRHPRILKAQLEEFSSYLRWVSVLVSPFHWQLEFPDAFTDLAEGALGFHAIIGNPPYDVLASKELGTDVEPLKNFLRYQPEFAASFVGKNNLYKLFICKALELLANDGYLGLIVPMPLLGDEQAIGVRKLILSSGTFVEIHAFPQKDQPQNRVFSEAKLSTAVFVMIKSQNEEVKRRRFTVSRHPGRLFERTSPTLSMAAGEIVKYDPANRTIVSCSQSDWDLAVRLMEQPHFCRLGQLCVSFQGEINETNDKGFLSQSPTDGKEVLRGASVCLYTVREASQGNTLYIRRNEYLAASAPGTKAWHSQERRIGFQRSAPQNNFRRLIAAPIESDEFCFDTVSYVPASASTLPLEVILALMNSRLLEWYFRLGSSNSKANEYQFNNLPCPVFSNLHSSDEALLLRELNEAHEENGWNGFRAIVDQVTKPPFSLTLQIILSRLAIIISNIESGRGEITRASRARLSPDAQAVQDIIDRMLFAMAGFEEAEVAALETRMVGLQ